MAAKKSEKKPVEAAPAVDKSTSKPASKAPARKAKAVAPVEVLAPAAPVEPTVDEIRERAYAIHLAGGASSLENWLQAERELRAERGIGA